MRKPKPEKKIERLPPPEKPDNGLTSQKRRSSGGRRSVVWKGPDGLRQFLVPVQSLEFDKENARDHDDRNVGTIIESFETNGQVQLLIVYKGVVRAGNGRLEAALRLNWSHVAVLDVTDHFASEEQATAFALMDNKSAELATWNLPNLSEAIKGLSDEWRKKTGFAEWELPPLLESTWNKPKVDTGDDGSRPPDMVSLHVTKDQVQVIRQAIAAVREKENDMAISEGRCLELIAGDYLAGA